MIGAWHESGVLYIANSLMFDDAALGLDEFADTEREWRVLLDLANGRGKRSEAQYCLAGTINAVFSKVVIRGPEQRLATIRVAHTLRD